MLANTKKTQTHLRLLHKKMTDVKADERTKWGH